MLISSAMAFNTLSIGMSTVIKSTSNVLLLSAERLLLGKQHGVSVWATAALLVLSAIVAGATDLSFNIVGYSWQTVNTLLTVAYMMTMKYEYSRFREIQ
jgi:GDP-mannose transporter